jgi:tripartite ATP-independent transporter DctP family solute receptor
VAWHLVRRRLLAFAIVGGLVAVVACAGPQQTAPAAAPAQKPATAAEPAKPAAEPAKPAGKLIELRAGTSNLPDFSNSRGVAKFAELVKEKTKGEVVIHVFYQSLGVQQQLTQSVMNGAVDMGDISNGNSGRFTTAFFNYDLPFLFKSYDNMLASLDTPIGQKAIAQFEKDLGVKVMFPLSWGVGRDIQTTKKHLKTPADIKGLKIRVVSTPIDLATFRAWGANPTPVDWAQTYTALQQGTVEGEQVPYTVLGPNKHYEVVKYNLRLEYQMGFEPFFINAKRWEALSPEHQKAMLEAAKEAKEWHYKDAAALAQKIANDLANQHGVTFYKPTLEEYAQWASIREKVWEEVAEQQKGKVDLAVAKQIYASQ